MLVHQVFGYGSEDVVLPSLIADQVEGEQLTGSKLMILRVVDVEMVGDQTV